MMLLALTSLAMAVAPDPGSIFTNLMNCIGSGTHVTQTVEMAAGIAKGKFPKDLMNSLGAVASKNKCPRNYERALHRWFRRQAFAQLVPEPYSFPLTVYGKTKISMKRIMHACILPHEWFGLLCKFPELFTDLKH